jgi:hypothetical protein
VLREVGPRLCRVPLEGQGHMKKDNGLQVGRTDKIVRRNHSGIKTGAVEPPNVSRFCCTASLLTRGASRRRVARYLRGSPCQ